MHINIVMQEFLPLQALKVSFKTDISKLHFRGKDDRTALYSAATSFGDMTLLVQTISNGPHLLEVLHRRNELIAKRQLTTPLVYEQEVVKVREGLVFCLTLTEPILLCKPHQSQLDQSSFESLVRCAYSAAKAGLTYEPQYLRLERAVRAQHNSCLFMDFTRVVVEDKAGEALQNFKSALCTLMQHARSERMQQVLFICSSPFVFNLQSIATCKSWFDLAMVFNLLHQQKLNVTTESRTKILPVSKLSGPTKVHHQGEQYQFLFRDGFRMDGVTELTLQQLKNQFFEEGTVYHMTKEKYMTVRKSPADRSLWPSRIEAQDLIYVRPEISKVQFINFLIAYMRFIEPLLHQIAFHAQENALGLAFTNQLGKQRRIVIKFHPKYVVKDEELSMVIEKSRMKNASISLKGMAIGDSFLIFLANCDKMAHIKALDISKCNKITESALNLLLASPFCKGLTVLKMNGLPLPDLQVIKSRGQLKELEINHCVCEQGEEIHVEELSIQRLQALGVPVHLRFPQSITHLCLNHDVPLEQLKALKQLPLVSLKIRLVEHKKSIGSFFNTFNNLYSKDNPVKILAEGACRKTLKSLDISHSTIKVKEIRPIIAIQTLQSLICEGLQKDRLSDLSLPHHILVLSLKGSRINAQQVHELTHRINFFIRLSLLHTDVTEKTLEIAIKGKKYINLLEVGEEQVFGKFFSKKSAVEGVELHMHKLLRDDNEAMLNSLLFSQLSVCKELNLHCDSRYQLKLAHKVHRFLNLYQDNLRGIGQLTLTINSVAVAKLLPLRNMRDGSCQNFTIVNNKSSPHRLKVNACTILAQEYRLAVTEQHLGANLFNVALHKVLHLYPEALLEVSIRNNRLLAANVITLLRKYTGGRLIALDFRNCLFSYADVQQDLYEFQHLQSVNEGEYQINLSEEDACEQQLQKILKFFLKLTLQEKMKLKLKAQAISERQLFFSIVFEILHHHSAHIVSVQIDFQNIPADHQAEPFWRKLFLLQKLEHLKVKYINDWVAEQAQQNALAIQFQKLANLNLFSLELQTSIHLIIPMQLGLKDLKRLSISYAGMEISEQVVAKLLKSTPTLARLTLALPNCQNLTSLGRISDALQRMPTLTHFSLNVQNSPIRQQSLFQLIEALHRNPLLQCFELNANNCHLDINQLAKVCQALVERIRFCHVFLFVMQARRPAFFRSQADLQAIGIQLVFTAQ